MTMVTQSRAMVEVGRITEAMDLMSEKERMEVMMTDFSLWVSGITFTEMGAEDESHRKESS
jgi:hypothetical protein